MNGDVHPKFERIFSEYDKISFATSYGSYKIQV